VYALDPPVGSPAKSSAQVDVLVVANDATAVADQAAKVDGVTRVLKASGEGFDAGVAETMTNIVLAAHEANKYSHIMALATNYGKNFLPRVAAKLDVAQISDVLKIEGEDTFLRPMYAGSTIAKVKSKDSVKAMTIRGTGFEKASPEGGSAKVEDAPAGAADARVVFKGEERTKSDRPPLESAKIVVSGGRGLKSEDNFKLIYDLADKMGAGVGASRAAVDAGFCPNDYQVGQTGKIVAPDLYVAVGISGAIQHLAGMKDSKTIVCINKDEEAPIFAVSDLGLVADLFKAVPEMTEKIPARA
jgi:electron transfer flavoprotein alpha subunit